MRPPRDTGPIHFVGIGGIGMSGIAELLADLGYTVQGSDQAESANVERLRARGVTVTVGHAAENVGTAAVVVISTAVKPDNPELVAARSRHIPVIRRAEMLAELMRGKRGISLAGTHGKTTTTTIMATLLEGAGYDPTVVNGGIINAWGTNARLGQSDWFVIEADESDGTFLKYPNEIALVSNIDAEHLDHWHSFDALKQGFRDFVMNLPFYGFAALCIDHPTVRAVADGITDRTVVTYGESADADARLVDFSHDSGGTRFSVEITDRVSGAVDRIRDIRLPMPGHHNALNATGAIAIARRIGITGEAIVAALAGFEGVKRRFTFTGEWNGVRIYDDYGHHPVEIAAVLKAARGAVEDATGPESRKSGRVIAIMQPHRYTRLSDLFDQFAGCFGEADTLYVADVYAAGEDPIEGADRDALVAAIRACGHTDARALAGPDVLAAEIAAIARPGDLVIFLGAGSITQWAHALPQQLKTNPEGVSA
ncbi:UDP-N-acetylmuramate--L-alanine ligase [Microbaculum marinisediminis]|uniref:UDP-N-acetylmuramate--L-alanine ligase n=1 Tax=Microbaculum marinisediminis TaxID=2931392 RepID=A0AAW5R133_9HYPH|nr:UDP-N-acetylmuramate--L-alanine ligase [Microbaculum sp. A6E488]MCT8972578.1 UDP-N-acetylmuramate--L-alanine ligase [Microbaculum sp. A6E488]